MRSDDADLALRGHVSLCTAGAWLTARPTGDDVELDHCLSQTDLKRRLRMKIFEADCFCLSCGACMDSFGDHALVCSCKGDRTVRHNAVRNLVYAQALKAGLRPEREKAGLLPQRPEPDGLATSVDSSRRRPADVWLPRGPSNGGEAWDFACTSGLRADRLETVAMQAPAVFADYEDFKRNYKDTDQICSSQGFSFVPTIAEAHSGAWSPLARKQFDFITQRIASMSRTLPEVESLKFAQRISITLHRENARAILRRMAQAPEVVLSSGWEEWSD